MPEPYSEPAPPRSTSEPEPQPIAESSAGTDDPGPAASADSESVAAIIARLAHDLMEASSDRVADVVKRVRDALGALLGAGGAPKPVKELLERIGAVVANVAQALDTLLGARGPPGPDGELLERIGAVVANVAQALGEALGEVLLGGSDAPDPATYPLAPTLAFYGPPERATELFVQTAGTAIAKVAQATGGALRAGGLAHPTDNPVAPPASPAPEAPLLPVPIAPSGPAPASASYFGASGSSAEALQLPFAILVLFSVALLQGGKRVCERREPLRPHSALRLAAERPG
jgi:hypothetical protein